MVAVCVSDVNELVSDVALVALVDVVSDVVAVL